MDHNDRPALGSSFGTAAGAYAEHRPDYARAAVRWALDGAPGKRVLDLGAGTGKLTATLAALGMDVVAVEPDPAMLAELRRALPTVRALPGRAEAIPLETGAADAVLSGNALHWFDLSAAVPEMTRVLTRGGVAAGLWNVLDDRTEWIAGLAQVTGSAAIGPRDTPSGWHTETTDLPAHLATGFATPERAEFPHAQRRTAASFTATLATKAGMLAMPKNDRESVLTRTRTYLASRPETAAGEFSVPMLTCVLRTRRR